LRPTPTAASIKARYGSHALAAGARLAITAVAKSGDTPTT
jgi:hypothetical protein